MPETPQSHDLVELWKQTEYIKFRDHLERLEGEKSAQLAAELGRVKKIERTLKLKLVELENKERELGGKEIEVKRAREETALKLKRQAEEHAGTVKLLHQQHAAALAIERQKSDSKPPVRSARLKDTTNTKNNETTKDLEVQLKMKQFELDQALEREGLLVKSRDHFRAAVLKLTRDRMMGPDAGVVVRLQQRRAELLASGLYREEDDTGQQLDEKISRALNYTM